MWSTSANSSVPLRPAAVPVRVSRATQVPSPEACMTQWPWIKVVPDNVPVRESVSVKSNNVSGEQRVRVQLQQRIPRVEHSHAAGSLLRLDDRRFFGGREWPGETPEWIRG